MTRLLQILDAVRSGLVVVSAEEADLVQGDPAIDDAGRAWLPRHSLDTAAALASAGYSHATIRGLFALGRERPAAELEALVQAGQRTSAVRSRRPYRRSAIDRLTEEALHESLRGHRQGCPSCVRGRGCFAAGQVEEELARLFPIERRATPRGGPGQSASSP